MDVRLGPLVTLSGLFWSCLGLGVLVPAVLAAIMPRRRLVQMLAAWFVSPVLVYAGVVAWEALTRPGVRFDAAAAFYGLLLISPILAPPWTLACLAGVGLGLVARMLRPARNTADAEPQQAHTARPMASAMPATTPDEGAETPGWRSVHIGFEGDALRIGGLMVWQHKWRPEGGVPIRQPHPTHPDQLHDYEVFTIGEAAQPVRFAAGELSNGVWGFSIRRSDPVEAQGASQDGTLLYQHRLNRPQHSTSPAAMLTDATTGQVLADGSAWASSRITPNADGTLFLRLRQNRFDVLFRIDSAARAFWDHGEMGERHPLADLAATAERARRAILENKAQVAHRDISPNATIRVDRTTTEWANSHWVNTPRVVALATGQVMLDLWDTDWDATASFPRGSCVRLDLRRYRQEGRLTLEIDAALGTFRILPPGPAVAGVPAQPLSVNIAALNAASWPGRATRRR